MALKEQLMADFKEAMKARDEIAKNTINLARAAVKQYEVDNREELDDAGIIAILSIVDSLFLTNLLNSVSDPGADILSFPQQLFTVLNTYLISDCGNNIVGYIFFAQFT